jgi:metal-responsive CopG/Arc/MetJ family transcriptional regulator
MSKRINIILPDTTVAVLNRVTTKGNRSRFIDRAVRRLVATEGGANLRARLKAEAIENATRDLEIATEWFPLEQEAMAKLTNTTANSAAKKPRRSQRK